MTDINNRAIAHLTILLVMLTMAMLLIWQPHFYGFPGQTQNFGLVLGDCYHFNFGYEFLGTPGFFIDQC
jgi:hypothetical protein